MRAATLCIGLVGWLLAVYCCLILVACGGGGGGGPVTPPDDGDDDIVVVPTVAPGLAGKVEQRSASAVKAVLDAALQVSVSVTNTNPSGTSVTRIRYCLKQDPGENSPLTSAQAADYCDGIGAVPADVDVQEVTYTSSPQTLLIDKFKESALAAGQQYWISAVFVSANNKPGPATNPMRFKVIFQYHLVEPPALGTQKSFHGKVFNASGNPLPGAFVQYFHCNAFFEGGISDAGGNYSFSAFVPDDSQNTFGCYIQASHAEYTLVPRVDVDSAYTQYDVDLHFTQGSIGAISITSVSPTTGGSGQLIQFIPVVEGGDDASEYTWNFGEAATPSNPSEPSPRVVLENVGTYPCSLTVREGDGSSSDTYGFNVTVVPSNEPPQVVALYPRYDDHELTVGSGVEQDVWCLVTGTRPIKYAWNFANGATPNNFPVNGSFWGTDLRVVHIKPNDIYPADMAGIYGALLNVENDYGSASLNFDLLIQQPPSFDLAQPVEFWGLPGGQFSLSVPTRSGSDPLMVDWSFGGAAVPNSLHDDWYYAHQLYGYWAAGGLLEASNLILTDAGVYTGTVQIENTHGTAIREFIINVGVPLIDSIEPITGYHGAHATFISNISGDDEAEQLDPQYLWEFGGGATPNTSTDASPQVMLWGAGVHSGTLTIHNVYGSDEMTFEYEVLANELPVASLQADPMSGVAPLSVVFDASSSSDPDGSIVRYEWDMDNDGVFEFDSDWDSTLYHNFDMPGEFTCLVRVTDDRGGIATASVQITTRNATASGFVRTYAGAGVAGVTITFSGGLAPVTTGADGSWVCTNIPQGSYTAMPGKTGCWFIPAQVEFNIEGADVTVSDVHCVDQFGPGDWSMFGGKASRQHRSPYIGSASNDLKWTFTTTGSILSSPAISIDGAVYFGSDDGYLYAVNPDGVLRWAQFIGGEVRSSPAIGADGTVYLGSTDGNFHAIAPTGAVKWTYPTTGAIVSSPAISADGTIYFGCNDYNLYALNPSGSLKWVYATLGAIQSSPAIGSDGSVYFGSDDGALYALYSSGTLKWKYQIETAVQSTPAIKNDGTIYFASGDTLYSMHSTGAVYWSYTLPDDVFNSPAIAADGTIYIGVGDYLFALNSTGMYKWSFDTGNSLYSSPAIDANGTVYVGSSYGAVHAIGWDGNPVWEYPALWSIRSSPAIGAGGELYVGCNDGSLYSFGS